MIINTCGVVSTIIGGSNSNNDLIIAGSGISLIGSIIVWDSHKWFSINKNIYSKNRIPLILPNLKSNKNKKSKEPIKKIKLKTKNPVF